MLWSPVVVAWQVASNRYRASRLVGTVHKVDLKKELKHLYSASARQVVQVEVPALRFLMIDGEGDPNTSKQYVAAVEALFSVSYTVKFMVKRAEQAVDYAVMPLEGLWWSEDLSSFGTNDRAQWKWTMMILQPDFVSDEWIYRALDNVKRKKQLPELDALRLETFTEGSCCQILHVGPFTEEGPTIARLHDFILERSSLTGKHHEVYLSDIRRAAPNKWKTIIRQPFA